VWQRVWRRTTEIGLADVIRSLKNELLMLEKTNDEKPLVVNSIDFEIRFVVEKKGGATGKANYLFFAAEAKGEYKSQNVHTIKLSLGVNPGWKNSQGIYGVLPPSPGD
jgi:hypothetical protein